MAQDGYVPEDIDYLVKIVVIGDSGVGKSNIMTRFTSNKFFENSLATIGMSFATRIVSVDVEQDERLGFVVEGESNNESERDGPRDQRAKKVKVQVWDTAGQERHRALISQYYRGAAAALLVYDITNKKSFQNISRWMEDLSKYTNLEDMVMLLVGNKSDLKQRSVSPEEARAFAEEEGLYFIETSAKDGSNIDRAFCVVTQQLLRKTLKGGEVPRVRDRKKRASLVIDGVEVSTDEEHRNKASTCGC